MTSPNTVDSHCRLLLLMSTILLVSGVTTIHPSNLHHIQSKQKLREFLEIAAQGAQLTVFSYEVRAW